MRESNFTAPPLRLDARSALRLAGMTNSRVHPARAALLRLQLTFSSFCRERIVVGIGLSGKLVFQLV